MILREEINFPDNYEPDAKSLICHLTCHDLSKRIGNLVGGAQDVKTHKYFDQINFNEIKHSQAEAPYKPKASRITPELIADKEYSTLEQLTGDAISIETDIF